MNVGFFSNYEVFNNNRMFEDSSAPIGDNLMYPFVHLYKTAKSKGIEISTIDTQPLESYDIIFFIDFPTTKNKYFKRLIKSKFDNLNLLIFESEIIRPDNFDKKNYIYFNKIFTWKDNIVDNKKIFKLYLPNKIPKNVDFNLNKKKKLCTMIAANKFKRHPLELYSERISAIRWFEKNNLLDFDLFGIAWENYLFKGSFTKLNGLNFLNKILKSTYTSYKGPVESKFQILQKYYFSLCYENSRNIGYITEKIFDSFFAGCVPIYLGAPNITDYVPAETFIDKRKFDSYANLYNYIKNMPEERYIAYLEAIKTFITSEKIYPYSAEFFADNILNEIENMEQ